MTIRFATCKVFLMHFTELGENFGSRIIKQNTDRQRVSFSLFLLFATLSVELLNSCRYLRSRCTSMLFASRKTSLKIESESKLSAKRRKENLRFLDSAKFLLIVHVTQLFVHRKRFNKFKCCATAA